MITLVNGREANSEMRYIPYSFTVPAAGSSANIAISPAVGATERFEVKQLYVTLDLATTTVGGCSVRVGFGASTLPAISSTDSAPATGMLIEHAGVAPASGLYGIPGRGAAGEELRATVQTPADGSATINYLGRIVPA